MATIAIVCDNYPQFSQWMHEMEAKQLVVFYNPTNALVELSNGDLGVYITPAHSKAQIISWEFDEIKYIGRRTDALHELLKTRLRKTT